MRDVDGRRGCFWTDGNRCTVQGRKLRRSTTGGVHVGSAAFGDKWRVKQVRRRRFGLASSSVHVRRGRPPPHGSRRYRPLPGRARFHVDDGSVQTRAASPSHPLAHGRRAGWAADAPASARVRRTAFGWTCGYGTRGRRNAATATVPRTRHNNVLGSRNQQRPHRG
jgi:hypothetical protein